MPYFPITKRGRVLFAIGVALFAVMVLAAFDVIESGIFKIPLVSVLFITFATQMYAAYTYCTVKPKGGVRVRSPECGGQMQAQAQAQSLGFTAA